MKLIGLITLPLHKLISRDAAVGVAEQGNKIAFDETGRAWLLIERLTRLDDLDDRGKYKVGRVSYARWQAMATIPFVETDPVQFFDDGPAPAGGSSGPVE